MALTATLLSSSAFAGVPDWTMSEASGQVMVASSGMVRAASRGATLTAGDVISTGAKGRAVIVRGQEYLVVAPNSRIRVADPAQSGGMTQIIEQIGNVVFKIKKMATPHFAVETPFLAAVVKGTTFSVTVTESGASVQVIEGRVEVETRDGGARYLVLPGDIGSVSGKALGRLNVQGREAKTIVSPNEGRGTTAPTAQILQADPVATPEKPSATVVAFTVTEPPVRLASITDGLVSGALVSAVAPTPERAAFVERPTASGPDGAGAGEGASDGNANGNGNDARPEDAQTPAANDNANGNAVGSAPADVPTPAASGNANGSANGNANGAPPADVPTPAANGSLNGNANVNANGNEVRRGDRSR